MGPGGSGLISPTEPAENFGGFKSRVKKSDLKRLLEDYAGQLSPEVIGRMTWGRAGMLTARVLKLLVELELKRLG
jgi:hypothetical protein